MLAILWEGLLIRYLLDNYYINNLGNIVMIGVPNHGSEIADFLYKNKFLSYIFKFIYGPSSSQLCTYSDFTKSELPDNVDYNVGIIAGDLSDLSKLFAFFITDARGDGTVSVESTKINNYKDMITIFCLHYFLIHTHEAAEQTYNFIIDSEFNKEDIPSE